MAKKSAPKVQASKQKTSAAVPPGTGFEPWMPWVAAALAFFLFRFGFSNEMVAMDDHTATIDNPAVKDFSFFGRFNLGMYAPVTWAGYALAYALGGVKPMWYHVLSAVVHAANAALAFGLMRRWSGNAAAAFAAAVLFAIHPLQVEAVSWIAGFSTPLFSMFCLLSLTFYEQHSRQQGVGRSYWLALVLFLLACLAKTAAVTLPLTMLVVDLWQKRPIDRRNILEKVPFFAVSIVFGLLTLYSRGQSGHTVTALGGDFSAIDRFFMACETVLFYWTKILAPLKLSIWYPFERDASGVWPWYYYASPVVLAGLLFLAWRARRTSPVVWYGVLFYLSNVILALPYYTIGTFELRSDRYNYLALLGILAILTALPAFVKDRWPRGVNVARIALAVLGLFWLVVSYQRIGQWRDTLTLINAAMEASGDNFGKAYLWRGMYYGDKGQAAKAINDFTRALERDSTLIDAHKYRGGLYGMAKMYDKSIVDLDKYLSQRTNEAEIYFNRGLTLLNLNRPEEAMVDFNRALELNPNFAPAYRARGNTWMTLGDSIKARADMTEFERRKAKTAKGK